MNEDSARSPSCEKMEEGKKKEKDLLTDEQRWMGTLAAACLGAMAVRESHINNGNTIIDRNHLEYAQTHAEREREKENERKSL